MKEIKTNNYTMTTLKECGQTIFLIKDKATRGKKRKLDKLAWCVAMNYDVEKGQPIHYYKVLDKNLQEFLDILNA